MGRLPAFGRSRPCISPCAKWVFMKDENCLRLTRLAQARYANTLNAHGIVAFLIARKMPLDPVQPECQRRGQHPDGVIAGQVLQIRLDSREVPSAVLAHDGNQAAIFWAYVVGKQAQEQIILHFFQIMPPSRCTDQGVVARIPPIERFIA